LVELVGQGGVGQVGGVAEGGDEFGVPAAGGAAGWDLVGRCELAAEAPDVSGDVYCGAAPVGVGVGGADVE
jgi:hypothetical protein